MALYGFAANLLYAAAMLLLLTVFCGLGDKEPSPLPLRIENAFIMFRESR